MPMRNAVVKRVDIRALLGSGMLWAWFDAMFMSTFFPFSNGAGGMVECATWGVSVFGLPVCAFYLVFSAKMRDLLARRSTIAVCGAMGLIGSLCFVLSGFVGGLPLVIIGAVLCSVFSNSEVLGWGAVYCREGARSAMTYVAGGFSVAFFIDLLLLAMNPVAAAVGGSLLPLASGLLLSSIEEDKRTYVPRSDASSGEAGGFFARMWRALGVSPSTFVGIALIMVGFGYMQQQISFSPNAGFVFSSGGVLVQMARGIAALVIFALGILAPRLSIAIQRGGLLAIVAGFSLMPFLYGSNAFWVSGAVFIAGYTAFDVFIWIVIAHAVHMKSCDAFRTVCILRLVVNNLCNLLGAVIGIVLAVFVSELSFVYADATLVGYLMTVAVVLLMGSRGLWSFFDAQMVVNNHGGDSSYSSRIDALSKSWRLTQRERDVFGLLAVGRTQPWIAENLSISESTVNTHVRHIYAKAGVTSRQELIDLVIGPSCESIDKDFSSPA